MNQLRCFQWAVATALLGLLPANFAVEAGAAEVRSAEPFHGVTHYQVVEAPGDATRGGPLDLPRPLVMNVLVIDPQADGVRFLVQPGNGPEPGEVTRYTTRALVDRLGAQIGVNADFYDTRPPYPPDGPRQFTDVSHTGVSDGVAYSHNGVEGHSIFNVSPDNQPSVLVAKEPGTLETVEGVPLYNAVGGNQRLVTDGQNTAPPDDYTRGLHPHTVVGVTYDDKVLVATVDGRQKDYSEGIRTDELADVLIEHFDARDVLNLDGGGSTTMVMDDTHDGQQNARLINSPSDHATSTAAGKPRLVANSLAIFAAANPAYRPLPPPPRPAAPAASPEAAALTESPAPRAAAAPSHDLAGACCGAPHPCDCRCRRSDTSRRRLGWRRGLRN